jgi:hypothetical protein
MARLAIALALIACAAGRAAAEDGMRCNGDLISLGDGEAVVQQKCGAPTRSERRDQQAYVRGRYLHSVIDTWTYDRGRSEFVRILTFVDGVLRAVELGDYGKPAGSH